MEGARAIHRYVLTAGDDGRFGFDAPSLNGVPLPASVEDGKQFARIPVPPLAGNASVELPKQSLMFAVVETGSEPRAIAVEEHVP